LVLTAAAADPAASTPTIESVAAILGFIRSSVGRGIARWPPP
jgi:hypothetical protein